MAIMRKKPPYNMFGGIMLFTFLWKVLYKYRATRPDLSIYTVDDDWGVGVITRGQQKCCAFDNPFYEFDLFDKNRKEYLNLISEDEFMKTKLGE